MDPRRLGATIRSLRLASAMTQEELADCCELSRESIANVERGHHRIHADTLCAIADALAVRPCFLIEEARGE